MANGTELSGLDWFAPVFAVPLIDLIAAEPVDATDPARGLRFVVTAQCLNAGGVVHGGVLATVLDLAAYLSVLRTIGRGQQAVTHAVAASYIAAARLGETLVATGELMRRSRRLAFTTATVTSGERLVAMASVTKSIIDVGPPAPTPGGSHT